VINISSDERLRADWRQQPVVLQTSYAEVGVKVECNEKEVELWSWELFGESNVGRSRGSLGLCVTREQGA
jgi:hypothetical protein